jgi:hypothetical protein
VNSTIQHKSTEDKKKNSTGSQSLKSETLKLFEQHKIAGGVGSLKSETLKLFEQQKIAACQSECLMYTYKLIRALEPKTILEKSITSYKQNTRTKLHSCAMSFTNRSHKQQLLVVGGPW